MSISAANATRFNPLALPHASWSQPERLPAAAGVYFVLVNCQLRRGATAPHRVPYMPDGVLQKLAVGRPVALVLYVGMSNCISDRWNSKQHHKARCIEAMVSMLSRWFTVKALRIAYVQSTDKGRSSKQAERLERYLIKKFEPLLNDLAPIVQVKKRRSSLRPAQEPRRAA